MRLQNELRQMEHSKYCRTVLWAESAISCDCYMNKVHEAADALEAADKREKQAFHDGFKAARKANPGNGRFWHHTWIAAWGARLEALKESSHADSD